MRGAVNRKWCWMSKIPAGIDAGRKKECKTVVTENGNTIKDVIWSSSQEILERKRMCCDECRKAKESY